MCVGFLSFFCFLVDYFLLAILYIITLPQIVFFNFPFFFFYLDNFFVCFDFYVRLVLSITHYFFTVRFRPFVAAPVEVPSSIFSFHSVSHSFWPDWANQASSQLIFQHQQIQFMNSPLYTSNISLPLFNYNYHYLLFLQSLNLGSIHNYLRPAFFMYSI